jgi:hypothetical protein
VLWPPQGAVRHPKGIEGHPEMHLGLARVARGHPKGRWVALFFLFNFFLKNNFLSFIYLYFLIDLYFFIMIDTCRHFIGADVAPNRICQIF